MDETAALLLAGVLTFIFGWNNSSILIGNERGSGTLSSRESAVICAVGIILGVALEGAKMRGSLEGTIAGQATDAMVLATLAVSIALTAGSTLAAIPVSFSNTMVGAFTGAAFASSYALRMGDIATIVVFWVAAPLVTAAVTFLVCKLIERVTWRWSLLSVDAFNRAGVGAVSLALAYVLGANNIGLIYGTALGAAGGGPSSLVGSLPVLLVLGACAIVAIALFGGGKVAGTVGDRLLSLSPQGVLAAFSGTILVMWVATQLSIPISVSQCLIGGMFGAAFTKKIAIVNMRLSLEVVSSWVLVPLAAFAISALLVGLF